MRIQRKINLVMVLSGLLAIVLAAVFIAALSRDERGNRDEYRLADISNKSFQLSLLSQEVYLHPDESRPAMQWIKLHRELGAMLGARFFFGIEDQAVIHRLRTENERFGELFENMRKLLRQPKADALFRLQQERSINQINFIAQAMIADALYLQKLVRSEAYYYRRKQALMVLVFCSVFATAIALTAYYIGKSIMRPLLALRAGTEIVGSGRLDYHVGTDARDEVGELSRDFDTMLQKLREVTASREELAVEVMRRKQSEEALKKAQAIAHLGNWEWDVNSGEVRWSDEVYRIFGRDPGTLPGRYDTLLEVAHPDDREQLALSIRGALKGGQQFDVEYRILLPDGRMRVVHALGEAALQGIDSHPKIIGTIQDVTGRFGMKISATIQDVTERKELEWKLEQEAHTDVLTGASNRRHFIELAEQELSEVRRYGGELSILMLDLDHFKQVNDRYGHHVGDLVLQKLVQVARKTLREVDIIGRLGGEEFAILLPETGIVQAVEVGERLREQVAGTEVEVEGKPPIHFTTSIGATAWQPVDGGVDELLARADSALYAAKDSGRNRLCQS